MTSPGGTGVRRGVPRDLEALVELWVAVAEHHAAIDPLFTLRPDARPRVRAMLAREMGDEDAAVFVHEDGPSLDGFCVVRIDTAPAIYEEVERAEITDLYVRPEARRRGVGRTLVGEAHAWVVARAVARVEVRVAAANAEGQAFWRALGFEASMDVLQRRL